MTDVSEKLISNKTLSSEVEEAIKALIQIRKLEIDKLKEASGYCLEMLDFCKNIEFYKLAWSLNNGINVSINHATANLQSLENLFAVLVNEDNVSTDYVQFNENQTTSEIFANLLNCFNNRCLDHVNNITKNCRNVSNAIRTFLDQISREELVNIAQECAIRCSSISIVFAEALKLCEQFNANITSLISKLASGELSLFSDNSSPMDATNETLGSASSTDDQQMADIDNVYEKSSTGISIVKKGHISKFNLTMLLMLLPAVIVYLYCLVFYKPMYISTSEFSIRSSEPEQSLTLTPQSILSGNSSTDLYIANAFIDSLDLFNAVDRVLDLKQHFSGGDLFSGLSKAPTINEIEEFWKDIVSTDIDSESEIIRFSVRSYNPEFSLKIQQEVISQLDLLINRMNESAHRDAIRLAESEVEKAQFKVESSAKDLKAFRNNHIFISPDKEAENISSILSGLEKQLAEGRAELDQKLSYLKSDSVEIRTLRSKNEALDRQIKDFRSRIGGKDSDGRTNSMLSDALEEYENLSLKHEFAKKMLESAMSSLETARQAALAKTRYLVMVESPSLPDESLWPKPLQSAFITLFLTFFGVGIISLVMSAIREHLGV